MSPSRCRNDARRVGEARTAVMNSAFFANEDLWYCVLRSGVEILRWLRGLVGIGRCGSLRWRLPAALVASRGAAGVPGGRRRERQAGRGSARRLAERTESGLDGADSACSTRSTSSARVEGPRSETRGPFARSARDAPGAPATRAPAHPAAATSLFGEELACLAPSRGSTASCRPNAAEFALARERCGFADAKRPRVCQCQITPKRNLGTLTLSSPSMGRDTPFLPKANAPTGRVGGGLDRRRARRVAAEAPGPPTTPVERGPTASARGRRSYGVRGIRAVQAGFSPLGKPESQAPARPAAADMPPRNARRTAAGHQRRRQHQPITNAKNRRKKAPHNKGEA